MKPKLTRKIGNRSYTEEEWLEWIKSQVPGFIPWSDGEWRTEQAFKEFAAEDAARSKIAADERAYAFRILGDEITELLCLQVEQAVTIKRLEMELESERAKKTWAQMFYDLWWAKRVKLDSKLSLERQLRALETRL